MKKFTKAISGLLLIVAVSASFYPGIPGAQAQTKTADPNEAAPGNSAKITLRVSPRSGVVRQKADTELVMDVTGSMVGPWGSGTKWDAAKAALAAFVDKSTWDSPLGVPVEEWDKVGLVVYSTSVGVTPNRGQGNMADAIDAAADLEANAQEADQHAKNARAAADVGNSRTARDEAEDAVDEARSAISKARDFANEIEGLAPGLAADILAAAAAARVIVEDAEDVIEDSRNANEMAVAARSAADAALDLAAMVRDALDKIMGGGGDLAFSVNALCLSCSDEDARNNGLIPMDTSGKARITTFINGTPLPNGNTPIGAGLEMANRQLVAFAREEVPKYIVLASDGLQNNWPSPYDHIARDGSPGGPSDPTPLSKAIANNIRVITVGIGSDADATLLKDLACKTDPDCTAGNPDNNPSSPRNYFFAADDTSLVDLYERIKNQIASDFSAVVFDELNRDIFETVGVGGPVAISDWEVWETESANPSCTSGSGAVDIKTVPLPGFHLGGDPDEPGTVILDREIDGRKGVFVNFGKLSNGKDRCLILTVKVVNAALFDAGVVDCGFNFVDAQKDGGPNGFVGYTPPGGGAQEIASFNNQEIKIKCNLPWFQTKDGDVGVKGDTSIERAPLPAGQSNADYAVIFGQRLRNEFSSTKGWLVGNYSYNNPSSFERSTDIYASMRKFLGRCSPQTLSTTTMGEVQAQASDPECNIFTWTGSYISNPDWSSGYNGNPAVIFIDGSMIVSNDIRVERGHGVVFVVNGNINVAHSVAVADGVYIAKDVFNSDSSHSCHSSYVDGDGQLNMVGSVYAFGDICLQRSLVDNNQAAEVIHYAPEYLYLFREVLGESKSVFFEEAP